MQYELRLRQPIGENLCRIFRGQIKRALKVARGGAEPPDTRVHALRKHLKKARATLRLARGDTVFLNGGQIADWYAEVEPAPR